MALLVLMILFGGFYFVFIAIYSREALFPPQLIQQLVLQAIFTLLVLLAECIIYWAIRNRIYVKIWATLHVCSLYLVLLVLPLVQSFLILFLARTYSRAEYHTVLRTVNSARAFIYWIGLLAGHIFFLMLLLKAFRKDRKQENGTGLLDEFVPE